MSDKISVVVWDLAVRIFHWSLVLCFAIAYFSAEEENPLHIYSGYAVLGLVVFRIIWGFVGGQHARFSDFVFGPATVIDYLKNLANKQARHYLGHNPLGGWMVVLMLTTLLVVTVSGIQVQEAEEQGEASARLSLISAAHAETETDKTEENQSEEFWEEIHEGATNFMLLLIFLHLVGVKLSSHLHGEKLIKAMFTGRKDPQ